MNLPNWITLLRVLFIPAFIWFLFVDKYIAVVIFLVLALTDWVDGYLARRWHQITDFGKLMDPLADKLLVSSALIFLIGYGIPAWMVFVIIAREFAVLGLRMIALTKKRVIAAGVSGKIKTVLTIVAIVMVILGIQYSWHAMLVAVIVTVYSGVEYFWKGRDLLSDN